MKQAIKEKKSNKKPIVLSIDAMGGDLGPPAVVAGVARSASKNPNLHFILHGNQDILNRLISRRKRLNDCVEVVNATDIINFSATNKTENKSTDAANAVLSAKSGAGRTISVANAKATSKGFTLIGNDGSDTLTGGAGDDIITVSACS